MKTNKGLLEKRIDLSNCQINGGRSGETHVLTSTATQAGDCPDCTTLNANDKDVALPDYLNYSLQ
ncbi:hypothetical protein [Pedobacter alluvionis]|uniref:Uncharacterized protein n=1 Tax=Pedobacter alluvionis TaxID=475253 RepID=A0A497Y4Y9_9SPHI|nr:hypothetical protein [Pedobacter alluvionis]RLJ77177.1 hypothetical protein BCL90_2253 [Pedobacter alluvionis]TFB33589.1 hypothetical protein E3V97_05955 [Pedobacter alluvionis]